MIKRLLRHRTFYKGYGWIARVLTHLIGWTCRFRIEGREQFIHHAQHKKTILMVWHNRLAMTAEVLKRVAPQFKYAAVVSNSRDGEMISVLANSYRQGRSLRIPHHARAAALKHVIEELRSSDDIVIMTPDGPRGPALRVKPGIVFAAQKTSAHIIPLTWSSTRCWKLRTWDSLLIPKPFSTITVKLGTPIAIQESDRLEEGKKILENSMASLEGLNRPS